MSSIPSVLHVTGESHVMVAWRLGVERVSYTPMLSTLDGIAMCVIQTKYSLRSQGYYVDLSGNVMTSRIPGQSEYLISHWI